MCVCVLPVLIVMAPATATAAAALPPPPPSRQSLQGDHPWFLCHRYFFHRNLITRLACDNKHMFPGLLSRTRVCMGSYMIIIAFSEQKLLFFIFKRFYLFYLTFCRYHSFKTVVQNKIYKSKTTFKSTSIPPQCGNLNTWLYFQKKKFFLKIVEK